MGPDAPIERVLRMLGGKWITAALSAAARLGVPDALRDAPLTAAALAEAKGLHEAPLDRLLRVLAAEGLLVQDLDGAYALTELGAQLTSDTLGPLAAYVGSPAQWSPWAYLPDAVESGRSAFWHAHGTELFDYLDATPTDEALYHDAVDAFTRRQAIALADAYDFGGVRRVADIGGGMGALLHEVLGAYPSLEGVLFDRPSVAARAETGVPDALRGRLSFQGGDFFAEVPDGCDAYVIKHVIHNWGDEDAVRLLRRCADAMAPGGRVLVIEGIVLPGNVPDGTRLLDLEMLALCVGGYERSKPQFRALFAKAGLRLESTAPLVAGTRLLVCSARR